MKKALFAFLLAILLAFSTIFTVFGQATYLLGDIDGSGALDKFDYILLKRYVMGTITVKDEQVAAGDIDRSGATDKFDYILLKRHCMNTYTIYQTDPSLVLTQKNTVKTENFTNVSAFSTFLSASERFALVPGLSENVVPQGIGRNPETGYIYISSYFNGGGKASVISVLDPNGGFVAEYHVYTQDGQPFTGHMGGICVTEDYLYFSGQNIDGYYSVAEFALADLPLSGSHDIKLDKAVKLPIHTSYLSYDSGILWVGTFYLSGSYDLGKYFNFKTESADGAMYGGYAAGFVLDGEEKRLTVPEGENYAVPDYIIATPDKVQGFTYRDGCVVLSISYGRNNNSFLDIFNVDLTDSKKNITVDGKNYPLTLLDSANRKQKITAMCMTEGITVSADGDILVLFESAAQKYYNSKNPTDYIWEMKVPK
jgi:hypothetical protein